MSESMRVYVPGTFTELGRWLGLGRLERPRATAVTEDLRASMPGEDEEGLEFEALLDAADLSLDLVRADPDGPRRRVVVAADVAAGAVHRAAEFGTSGVRLSEPLAWAVVVSVHADERASEGRVLAGDLEDVNLLWFAPQEVEQLIAEAIV